MSKCEKVVILGASDRPERYSYKAMELLEKFGHKTFLVHPRLKEIDGRNCLSSLSEASTVAGSVDTLTLYVNPTISSKVVDEIIKMNPGRVIFNPGTENPELVTKLDRASIAHEEACTLVLLNTKIFFIFKKGNILFATHYCNIFKTAE